jgi:putative addiction module component (TIGR02574 family)
MPMTKEQIYAEAIALDVREREALAEELLLTVDDGTREEVDAAWAEEIERRIAEYERGEVKAIPGDQVLRELRARHDRTK